MVVCVCGGGGFRFQLPDYLSGSCHGMQPHVTVEQKKLLGQQTSAFVANLWLQPWFQYFSA